MNTKVRNKAVFVVLGSCSYSSDLPYPDTLTSANLPLRGA